MNKKSVRRFLFSGSLLLSLTAGVLCLALPASPFFANGKTDPCVLDSDTEELCSFVSKGLLVEGHTAKTSGTITRIASGNPSSKTFFVERLDAMTRERTALRVEGYTGTEALSVGDYVTIEGTLSKDGESKDYWVNDPIVSSLGENKYGPVTPLELSSKVPFETYDDGLAVHALRFNLTKLAHSGDTVLFETTDGAGKPFFPLLIDTGEAKANQTLAGRLKIGSDGSYYKAYGNLEWANGSFALRVSSESDLVYVDNGPKTIDFYAINDFHGAAEKISKLATFFKTKKNGNHVFLNSGDMWQGSVLSNTNRGRLLTESMDVIGFDSFTLGNHEFDWGLDYIKRNRTYTQTPFLGANIYKYDQKTKKATSLDTDLVEPYAIKDLDNGLRVGIIGIIGQAQITSITSTNVSTVSFVDPDSVVPSLADELRNEKMCDVVILDGHASQDVLKTNPISSSVDAVFCAHTHQKEQGVYNGVPYIQGGSYGSYVSSVSMTLQGGTITSRTASNVTFSDSWSEDAEMKAIVDRYSEEISGLSNESLGTVNGNLSYNVGVGRLVTKALAVESESQGYSIDLALCNKGRTGISSGTLTYGSLYSVLPFDNAIYIAEVSGSDLIKEAKYNYFYRLREGAFESEGTYTIAVIDYLLFHQDINKEYDYFSDGFLVKGVLESEGTDIYNYRDITADYIRGAKAIAASEIQNTTNRNNASLLSSRVSF